MLRASRAAVRKPIGSLGGDEVQRGRTGEEAEQQQEGGAGDVYAPPEHVGGKAGEQETAHHQQTFADTFRVSRRGGA